jgi:hypothetical protein
MDNQVAAIAFLFMAEIALLFWLSPGVDRQVVKEDAKSKSFTANQ